MSARILSPHQWQAMPWVNGGGITHEILKESQHPWRYRISAADVVGDGPFSIFAGVDRQIMVLDGNGFELHFADGRHQSIRKSDPAFAFRGEDEVHCMLIDGPVRDLNVMTRRHQASAQVASGNLDCLPPNACTPSEFIHLALVLQGTARLELGQQVYLIDAMHALVLENERAPLTSSAAVPGTVIVNIALALPGSCPATDTGST